MVKPTKSGRMVERRDQVLIGRLSPLPRTFSTLPNRWWSTNGPFLIERPMSYPLFLVAAIDDHAAGAFVLACAIALGERAPGADRIPARGGLAFAAAVGVVDRVHGHAAHGRAYAAPAHATGLAHRFQRMLFIADFADGGAALDVHLAHFAGAQAKLGVTALAREELHRGAGRARNLHAFAGQHLDAMHGGADRNIAQRQGIARLDWRFRTRHELHAHRDALGRDDVAALAVRIAQQGQIGAAIRIVFQALDLGRDSVLGALEIDDAVLLLVATALMAHGDMAVVVASGALGLRFEQGGVGLALVQVGVDDLDQGAAAR